RTLEVVQDREQRGEHAGDGQLTGALAVTLDPLPVVGVLGADPLQVPGALLHLGPQRLQLGRQRGDGLLRGSGRGRFGGGGFGGGFGGGGFGRGGFGRGGQTVPTGRPVAPRRSGRLRRS